MRFPNKTSIAAIVGLATVLIWQTGYSVPPVKQPVSFDVVGSFLTDCDGFSVLSDFSGEGHVIFFKDKYGNIVRQNDHILYVYGKVYNSTDSTKFLISGPTGEVENLHWDFVGDPPTIAIAGTSFKITIPGFGIALLRTGRLVFNLETGERIFQAGPLGFQAGGRAALCAALT